MIDENQILGFMHIFEFSEVYAYITGYKKIRYMKKSNLCVRKIERMKLCSACQDGDLKAERVIFLWRLT